MHEYVMWREQLLLLLLLLLLPACALSTLNASMSCALVCDVHHGQQEPQHHPLPHRCHHCRCCSLLPPLLLLPLLLLLAAAAAAGKDHRITDCTP